MLRIKARIEAPTGYKDLVRIEEVTIVLGDEALVEIAKVVASQQSFAPDAPPESCEHGNLRGKCPVEICSYSKHGGRW